MYGPNPETDYSEFAKWVGAIMGELSPKRANGKLVMVTILNESTFLADDLAKVAIVERVPCSFLKKLFGFGDCDYLVFSVVTGTFLDRRGLAHDGDFQLYPELKAIAEKHSPYLRRAATSK